MSTDSIERVAWQGYADACLEHDGRHGQRAAAEVKQLHPQQRPADDEGGRTLGP